jgi:hypothetical protein
MMSPYCVLAEIASLALLAPIQPILKPFFISLFSEPRAIQQKLMNGVDFCFEANELLLRCVSPLKTCFNTQLVTEAANALLHDVVPLNKPRLFQNLRQQGKNCSKVVKQYAAKNAQPILRSDVCK